MLELCEQKPGATQQEAISSGDGDSQTFPLKKFEDEEHDNLEGTLSTCDHSNTGVWLQHKIQLP